ncbi:MAG: GntR family transcriptional regulator [Myxococcota bacterium]
MFAQIPRESSVEACERTLRLALLRNELQPGQRLPPERHLAEQLGVNRQTLRAALASLRHQGLLAVRQGSGAVVQDFREVGGPELIGDLLRDATEQERRPYLEDLLAVRRSLAALLLSHLARRPTEAAAALAPSLDRYAEVVRSRELDVDAIAEADIEVMAALLEVVPSPVLRLCLNPLTAVLSAAPELRVAIYSEPTRSLDAYRVLLQWLEAGAGEGKEAILAALETRDGETLRLLEVRE